ncbi:MAG: hypothetical protein C5B60_04740 [Chloroflexi bacterium]|nr:MAG: hypothetical protein C5B60_04740 [Chloroflexota bacterium]
MKFGATGKFPAGKLNETDKGEIVCGISYDMENDLIRIEFGTPLTWMAMEPEHAADFANTILNKVKLSNALKL